MTTIAYRDGIMAADTGMSINGARVAYTVKIARNDNGDLAGACGDAAWCAAFLRWFHNNEEGEAPKIGKDGPGDVAKGLIVRSVSIKFQMFESGGSFECTGPYYALGSGRSEALGAMWVGACASEAVRAAIAHDEGTFGEVLVLRA